METRAFGADGAPAVPIFGQGTWRMEADDRAGCVAALRRGLDAGLTHVDTAELYGGGAVEEIVAEAIAGRRDEVFLVSKVLPSHATRAGVERAAEASLRRLRTDRLDGYLLHWPGAHPLEETIAGFEALRAAGKVRSWGVSNFDVGELERALDVAGPGRIACNQVLYHLEERGIEHRVAPWCRAHGVALVAYSPFGAGAFPAARSAGGQVLARIAGAHEGATPRQVALRFLVRTEGTFAIPKAARVEHAADNAGAFALRLDAAEIDEIDRAFPRGKAPRRLPVV